jgi:hypothetical protein
MTDTTTTTEAPRNDAGQFESSEPAYGREGLERAAGYVPMTDENVPVHLRVETPDDLTVKEAAAQRLKELSGSESQIVTHTAGLPANVTMTLDQAADALADARGADKAQAEIDGTKKEQRAIDKLRGEKPAAPAQIETENDVERALANPKIRDAIAERVTAADTQRGNYEASIKEIGKARIAALVGDFPEMANLPLNQWAAAITAMHQREPARAKQVFARLQGLAQVEAAVQHIAQHKTAREQTEFKAYAAKENARFTELTKGISPKEMEAVKAEIPRMLKEYGVSDPHQFLAAIHGQSTFPRASAERIMVDAAKWRMAKRAAMPSPRRTVPNVTRPGIAGPRGAERSDSGLAALNAKLSKSGSIKDATALLMARRSKGR